ncbi:Crp/Fnr family transcriptional regulator [Cloacibacillus sp. An23]|uniref:Crp/Fnr family transcriptional regulator n=1 Tax=Cloacibacillus sp. An23 TaxID=1965591 RepID=UPI00194EB7CA|nr:Crp/Fnr family transcriptional regulator [Cloacibacillus sp. An23]
MISTNTPCYFFTGDFSAFHGYFLSRPHEARRFARGEFLWRPGEPFGNIHYIMSGAARCCVEHENGRRKIISFHGAGTIFPVYHERDYKIELAVTTEALSPVETLAFTKSGFRAMFEENRALAAAVVEWYASYVNLLLYDTAHQEYNGSFLKLCNLLYLLAPSGGLEAITQEELADVLGTSRVNLTRGLAQLRSEGVVRTRRGCVEIIDREALARRCSLETVDQPDD